MNAAADDVEWERLLDAFKAAADQVDRKELLFRLDVRASQFSDAIGDREKHVHLRWLVGLANLLPAGADARREQLAGLFGYDVVERVDLTPEEELAKLKAAVRDELGAAGARILASYRGRR